MTRTKPSRLAREIAEMTETQHLLGIKALPYEKREPNKVTTETLAKSERGEGVHRFKSADAMFKALDI